jgi:hypothetical protein
MTMTIEEYLSPERFPLTTRKGLTPQQHLMIDAFDCDKFRELDEAGQITTERGKALWAELQAKEKEIPRLTRELAEAEASKWKAP